MEAGSNKSLFTLITVVIFGVFLALSYWMFQDELKSVLGSVIDNTSEMTSIKLNNNGLIPTAASNFVVLDNGDGTCTLTKYTGVSDKIIIPSEVNGLTVIKIAGYFNDSTVTNVALTEVILPETLKEIGGFAFVKNKLGELKIPEGVENINGYAFYYSGLTKVTLPNSLKYIGSWAFEGNSLTTVKVPDKVTILNSGVFYNNKLETINLPNTLTTIGTRAFQRNNLKSITIPENVKYLGEEFMINNTVEVEEIRMPLALKGFVNNNANILLKSGVEIPSGTSDFLFTNTTSYTADVIKYY